ncbi:endonuclease/exonuclease/phosphatase family protein [Sediminispirochaeta smaragdinae]|uniref:Endonuclease/exonuclease/phosphatase n=1 Tax=Sediminispirochaeta smaragdinae (strain DSM 11293 / JCM 15392 / SEBR 4228) TaxID=573413 RepID=E1R7S5_SEDSS|nr:endonuclease/exonuclease/phosphatase family protein [Sediminispirochaeta smaragdinae]ADK82780.1 Endonuclease/exonuclease/phosphatase [Sediminispirochaeta smaragdinae DSM 11293]
MKEGKITILSFEFFVFAMAVFLSSCTGCSWPTESRRDDRISLMSWNVQNVFDARDDGTEYPEFDPASGWGLGDYRGRLASLSEVIRLAVPGGADVVMLMEIEHGGVLDDLANDYVQGLGYDYWAASQGADSAVQLGILSRFPIRKARSRSIHLPSSPSLRPIFEVELEMEEGEPLFLFVCHWKSKSGGAEDTEPLRIASASLVRKRIQELEGRQVIVVGDLNEAWNEWDLVGGAYQTALLPVSAKRQSGELENGGVLFDEAEGLWISGDREDAGADGCGLPLYTPWPSCDCNGSYYYRGGWEGIDHMLFSAALVDGRGIDLDSFSVAAEAPWCDEDGIPVSYRMRDGYGYSDHLPIVATLRSE